MRPLNLILFLLIGIAAGWLAGRVMKGKGFGLLTDLLLGVVGAFFGGWLFGLLGISLGGILGSLITAFIGALVLLFVMRAVKKG